MRVIFFQLLHVEIRIIDDLMGGFDLDSGLDGPVEPADWADAIRKRPYSYSAHILPHDGDIKQYTGRTFKDDLAKAGIANCKTLFRGDAGRKNPWTRIQKTWGAFNRFIFNTDNEGVKVLMKHLSSYHTKTENDGITVQEKPNHDWSSHYADALGSIIDAIDGGYCAGFSGIGQKPKRTRKPVMQKYSAFARR